MVTLATGPPGLSRLSRLGASIGTGFSQGFTPSFQQTTKDLEFQKRFNPIREALQAQLTGGQTSPGQQLIRQITDDPNIFAQVMQNPALAQTIQSLNTAVAPVDKTLTGFSELDEINRTFAEALKADAKGEKKRAKILFSRVNELAGVEGQVDPKLDLVHLIRAGTDLPIPVQLRTEGGGIQDLEGKKLELEPGDRLLESLSVSGGIEGVLGQTEARNLNDAQVATESFIATAGDALRLLQEEPGVNTITGRAVALLGDLRAEAKTFATIFGMQFDESQLNPDTYNEQFGRLGINNARMRSLITSMAFQAASAAGSRGQSVSNRDIERFIDQVGGSAANPEAFAAVLRDEAERTARNFRINFRVRTLKEFEGELGLSGLPGVATPQVDQVDVSNLTTEELLKRLGL